MALPSGFYPHFTSISYILGFWNSFFSYLSNTKRLYPILFGVVTNYSSLSYVYHRNLFVGHLGAPWSSRSLWLQGQLPLLPFPFVFRWPLSCCSSPESLSAHVYTCLCACSDFLFLKTYWSEGFDIHPNGLMLVCVCECFFKCPISNHSHILRYWGSASI